MTKSTLSAQSMLDEKCSRDDLNCKLFVCNLILMYLILKNVMGSAEKRYFDFQLKMTLFEFLPFTIKIIGQCKLGLLRLLTERSPVRVRSWNFHVAQMDRALNIL